MPRIVMALMLREMATTYGRSAGGYLWAILEPILGIALLSVIFSLALARPGRTVIRNRPITTMTGIPTNTSTPSKKFTGKT